MCNVMLPSVRPFTYYAVTNSRILDVMRYYQRSYSRLLIVVAAIGILCDLWSLTADLNCVTFIVGELVPVFYK